MRANTAAQHSTNAPELYPVIAELPDMSKLSPLSGNDLAEVMEFLSIRPVHTVVMSSLIRDNGIESDQNRGKFFGYRGNRSQLVGVALIGHSTLVEAHTNDALRAFAFAARTSQTPIHLIMSDDDNASEFWRIYSGGSRQPRLSCKELLFETAFPYLVRENAWDIRNAVPTELMEVAEAQAEVAFRESGIDPMVRDRDGFLARVERRIEQDRVFVVYSDGKLIFKADIVAQTDDVSYLEGVWVAPEWRGQGVGSACLAKLNLMLLPQTPHVCLLSNVEETAAHRSFQKAGFRQTGQCTTIFV